MKVNNEDDDVGDDNDVIVARNSKNRMPPSIHNHHMRNSFLREFNKNSILSLEKDILKEILDEKTQ